MTQRLSSLTIALLALTLGACSSTPTETEQAAAGPCDRACLEQIMTTYLNALVAHDPSQLPVSETVRFTEDTKDLQIGQGIWESIESLGSYRQDILDPEWGIAGAQILVNELSDDTANGETHPVLLAIRLKVEDRLITEIETTAVRNKDEGMIFEPGNLTFATKAMNAPIPQGQRDTRDQMIAIATKYPEGLKVGSFVEAGTEFADEAYRFENGQFMAGPECTIFPGCDNIKTQGLPTLSEIVYRVVAVDEEAGIVWLRMNFGARSTFNAETSLSVWEAFKVYDDRIQAVEAFMEQVPYGTPDGWGR